MKNSDLPFQSNLQERIIYHHSLQLKNRFTFYLANITNLTWCKRLCKPYVSRIFKTEGSYCIKKSGMLVISQKLLVSLRVFRTKRHYFKLSKYLLGCFRRNHIKTLLFMILGSISKGFSNLVYKCSLLPVQRLVIEPLPF